MSSMCRTRRFGVYLDAISSSSFLSAATISSAAQPVPTSRPLSLMIQVAWWVIFPLLSWRAALSWSLAPLLRRGIRRATSVVCDRTYRNRFGSGNMYNGPVVGARVAPHIGVPVSIKTARATSVAGMSVNISGGCGTGVGVLCEAP
jgi:hypothetical protein